MQHRALVYFLTTFAFALSLAHADTPPELPKKITDLKATQAESKSTSMDAQELASLKSTIKAEILDELRGEKIESRAPTKPKLNFVELEGYFRTRADALSRCYLGTFTPSLQQGSSQCAPSISYFNPNPLSDTLPGGSQMILSSDLRLRVDPTLNISEDIRIKGRFDFLDNVVLGSTPAYMTGTSQPNPAYPIVALPGGVNQNTMMPGINNQLGPVAVKRLWGEVSFAYGEFKFGRVPYSWGLGILFNSGDDITQDFGNNVDGFFFKTRVGGFDLEPGFTVSYTGPIGRGGGLGVNGGDKGLRWFAAEGGSRYDLDPTDNVYNFHISVARKDCPLDIQALLDDNRVVFNYGALGVYRFQVVDSLYTQLSDLPVPELRKFQVPRNAHLGITSLWTKILAGNFLFEAEAAGTFGQIGNGQGLWSDPNRTDFIWVYQGGIALESRYGFMQNRLQLGLDAGWASGDTAPGFGIRPGLQANPGAGMADGQQYGGTDNTITNFTFDRDYRVDLLLFREVLGTITDAVYARPHVAYYFTDNFGLRGDVVASITNFPSSTPGNNTFLGTEIDASMFFKTTDGFQFNLQYGYLFPFDGLNQGPLASSSTWALRFMGGVAF